MNKYEQKDLYGDAPSNTQVYKDTDSIDIGVRDVDEFYAFKQALNSQYGMYNSSNAITENRLAKLETHRTDFAPYLQRVLEEAKKLNSNICKLRKYFLEKKQFSGQKELREEAFQRQQLTFMEGYLEMLLY